MLTAEAVAAVDVAVVDCTVFDCVSIHNCNYSVPNVVMHMDTGPLNPIHFDTKNSNKNC